MQECALPVRIDCTTVEIIAVAGGPFAFGEVERGQVAFRFIRLHAGSAETFHEQARYFERRIAHRFGVDTETALM